MHAQRALTDRPCLLPRPPRCAADQAEEVRGRGGRPAPIIDALPIIEPPPSSNPRRSRAEIEDPGLERSSRPSRTTTPTTRYSRSLARRRSSAGRDRREGAGCWRRARRWGGVAQRPHPRHAPPPTVARPGRKLAGSVCIRQADRHEDARAGSIERAPRRAARAWPSRSCSSTSPRSRRAPSTRRARCGADR